MAKNMTYVTLLILIGSAAWVLYDARSIGVKKGLVKGFGDMGPWGWSAAVLGIWIVAFPFYIASRNGLRLAAEQQDRGAAVSDPEVTLSGWAVAAFYLGLVSILVIPAPVALLCGVVALVDIRRSPAKSGVARAVFGVVLGGLMSIILVLGVLHGTRHS
jgi:hypothetical protein